MGIQLKCGLWLYHLDKKSLDLVAEGNFENFTWITNVEIAAIRNIAETSFEDNQIVDYVISDP
jgi:hypothetical protein